MNQCECYHQNTYRDVSGVVDFIRYECYGTKERDMCSCGGDKTKCDFYPDVREKALTELFSEKNNTSENVCQFCSQFDFNKARVAIDKHGVKIELAICNTEFPKEEQFKYCPLCGRKILD